jgi:hypothetical protein
MARGEPSRAYDCNNRRRRKGVTGIGNVDVCVVAATNHAISASEGMRSYHWILSTLTFSCVDTPAPRPKQRKAPEKLVSTEALAFTPSRYTQWWFASSASTNHSECHVVVSAIVKFVLLAASVHVKIAFAGDAEEFCIDKELPVAACCRIFAIFVRSRRLIRMCTALNAVSAANNKRDELSPPIMAFPSHPAPVVRPENARDSPPEISSRTDDPDMLSIVQ